MALNAGYKLPWNKEPKSSGHPTLATSIRKISVLVPTRNRAESLRALIQSLESAQAPQACAVEIVAVDNGSSDGTMAMLQNESTKGNRFPLRVFCQPQLGKSHALNMGLANCDGDLIMVFDDDVTVDVNCLVQHVEAYQHTGFSAIQGKVLPGTDANGLPPIPERLGEYNIPLIDYGSEIIEIRGLTGTNMSFKRAVLDTVGLFDVRLGPGASGFSEDTEFSMRLRKAGFQIGYTPHAVAYHELNPARFGRAYNRNVQYRKGLSRSLYRNDSIVFNVLPNLAANSFRYLIYKCFGRTQKAYKTEGRVMKYWGYLMGKLRQRMSRSSKASS